MKAKELNAMIPYSKGGKEKILEMSPYENITLKMPGRHAMDTNPVGGDFCVCITDPFLTRNQYQFTHTDLFYDLEFKKTMEFDSTTCLMEAYLEVLKGEDPNMMRVPGGDRLPGIDYVTFLRAVQCLAVAEHRRYHQYESSFGGRYLPFRFAAGIVEEKWTAERASLHERKGIRGVMILELDNGIPALTRILMGLDET